MIISCIQASNPVSLSQGVIRVILRTRRVLVWPPASWNMGEGTTIFQKLGVQGRRGEIIQLDHYFLRHGIYSTSHSEMNVFKGYKTNGFILIIYLY